MEKIKITGSDQIYEIRSIIPVAEHVLQIIFADDVPEAWGGDIQLYTDTHTGLLIVTSVIDNMVKGAAGQAIQNMNLMFGLDESAGLKMIPPAF